LIDDLDDYMTPRDETPQGAPSPASPSPASSPRAGVLSRIGGRLRDAFARTPAPQAPATQPELPQALAPHAAKVCSAADAVQDIRAGDHVFVGTASATPRALVAALESRRPLPADIELLHFLTDGALPHDAAGEPTTRLRHRCFFVGSDVRMAVKRGLADYVPMSIARVPALMAIGRIPVDVALIQVSLPDAFGYVSLGVSVDIIPAAVARARIVIAEVNPAMPRSMGDSTLHVDQIHRLVPVDTPVIEYRHHAADEQVMEQIARYIGGIIEDGSTLQIGLGRVTNEALKYLSDRTDLGIHSDVVTDAIIPLLERGILTGRRKTHQPGKIVTSFAMGSRRLYDLIDRNPLFSFQPIEAVCHPVTIAAQHKMVSVTQAFAIDLTGQVCADQFDGDFYSGIAAQGEFLRGASRSEGGKPIICLASTEDDGRASRIRPVLKAGEGVTIARTDVHYVITEYGIAYLFGKSIRERAVALIDVAHPDFRAELFEQARSLGYVPADWTLKNMRAYPVEEEVHVTLKDGRDVLLRPSSAADGEAIRELFHRLPEHDVYTRFFRRVRGLSDQEVQRLCNVNFENEVAFVAAVGAREHPQIVAQACYFIDPSTNLAETAFMVHPDWQGKGLGMALERRMAEHARGRGVQGFVAEILPDNDHMIRLAKAVPGNVHVEKLRDTVRVTVLF
jgi:acyl-CoA hydrolase/GNAT superfamily N-acetyltransferase